MIFGTLGKHLLKWLPYTGALLLLPSRSGARLAQQQIRPQDLLWWNDASLAFRHGAYSGKQRLYV
jgi:hypothetical protein